MKKLLTISLLILLVSCKVQPTFPMGITKAPDNSGKDNEQDARLDDLERRVLLLEQTQEAQQILMNTLYADLDNATLAIQDNTDTIDYLQNLIDTLSEDLEGLETDILDHANDLNSLQNSLTITQNDISLLQNSLQKNITELIDPCGDKPGSFDEVLLKLADGTIIAYFQSGNKRHLSVLQPGNYKTTDAQKCTFSIDNNGNINY